MMGMQMGQMPELPTIKELWKNEKSKYRQWMILFAIGVAVVFALLLTSAIFNLIGRADIEKALNKKYNEYYAAGSSALREAIKSIGYTVNVYYIGLPMVQAVFVGIGLILFIVTLFESYKEKNFGKISGFSTMIIGAGAFMAFFQLIRLFWSHGGTFDNPGGIFQFVNYFLLIGVYFGGSSQVSRIRRTFIMSERIAKIKASPEYQQAQQQAQAMMNGQAPTNPIANPYGPAGVGTPMGSPKVNATGEVVKSVEPEISKERQELEKMSVSNLKKVAKKLSISGYSTMKKPELIKSILRVTSSN